MKNSTITLLASAALAFALAPTTQAIPISGSLDILGTATLDTTSLATATKTTAYGAVTADDASTGAYAAAGAANAAVTMVPFSWNPSDAPHNPLWSFTYAGNSYAFNLSSLTVISQSGTFLNLTGQGVATITGYDATPGDWSFTISNANGKNKTTFGFQSNTAVPDGGSTAMLLGLAFLGLGTAARLRTV